MSINAAEALRRMTNPETDPGATKLSNYVDPAPVSDGQNVTSAANPNPIPSEDVHSQVANPTNQSGDVGIPNQPKENNDPISRYQKYVEGIQRPDLSSLLTGYDQQTNQAANDVKKAESNRKWAALADLGNLVGGYIGARGGANVNVNPQNNEGVYNQAINKLSNTYRQYQSGRPDLVAKLALQKYNEQMQGAGAMLKGIELSDKEKEEFNKDQIALKTLQWRVNNGTATLQQRKDYDDANIRIKKLMANSAQAGKNIAAMNANTNRGRLIEEQGKNNTQIADDIIPNNRLKDVIGEAFQAYAAKYGTPKYTSIDPYTQQPITKDIATEKELETWFNKNSNNPIVKSVVDKYSINNHEQQNSVNNKYKDITTPKTKDKGKYGDIL